MTQHRAAFQKNSFYLRAIKHGFFILALLYSLRAGAQDPQPAAQPTVHLNAADLLSDLPFVKREEVLNDGKRYRLYNNYLTFGAGFLTTSLRQATQKVVSADFNFHIRKHYFQAGGFLSGIDFFTSNNAEVHICYGVRNERKKSNFTLFMGPSFFTGVTGTPGISDPSFYNVFGIYMSGQAIYKLVSYDIGLGLEAFAEVSDKQQLAGAKIIFFFSSSYRGLQRPYNGYVRDENPGLK